MSSCYPLSLFLSPPTNPDLLCGVCSCVISCATETACGHVFGKVCLTRHLANLATCPALTCQLPINLNELTTSSFVERQIKQLRVKCVNMEGGCAVEGQLKNMGEHERECAFRMVECKFCAQEERWIKLSAHEEVVSCGCGESFQRCLMTTHKHFECDKCAMLMPIGSANEHSKSFCEFRLVACPHCNNKIAFRDLESHAKLELCMLCNAEEHACLFVTGHGFPCQYACDDAIRLCVANVHAHTSICPNVPVACVYAKFGCTYLSNRFFITSHESDLGSHFFKCLDFVVEKHRRELEEIKTTVMNAALQEIQKFSNSSLARVQVAKLEMKKEPTFFEGKQPMEDIEMPHAHSLFDQVKNVKTLQVKDITVKDVNAVTKSNDNCVAVEIVEREVVSQVRAFETPQDFFVAAESSLEPSICSMPKIVAFKPNFGSHHVATKNAFQDAVFCQYNSRMYFVTWNPSDFIYSLDLKTFQIIVESTQLRLAKIDTFSYNGGAYCPVKKRIYFLPHGSYKGYFYHYWDITSLKLVSYSGPNSATHKFPYSGGCFCPTLKRIYLSPSYDASSLKQSVWHYIDCMDGKISSYGSTQVENITFAKYCGAVFSPAQNKLFFVPTMQNKSNEWHFVNCQDGNIKSYSASTEHSICENGYSGGVYSPLNDRIYLIPSMQAPEPFWHYICCATLQVFAYSSKSSSLAVFDAYHGGVYSPLSNRIYLTPHMQVSGNFHFIDCETATVTAYSGNGTAGNVLRGYVGGCYSIALKRVCFAPLHQSSESCWHYLQE